MSTRLCFYPSSPMFLMRLVLSLTLALVSHRLFSYCRLVKRYGGLPGYRPLFDPHSLPGNALPPNSWSMGFMWSWIRRRTAHFNHKHDLTTLIPIFGNACYIAASVDIAKQIWSNEGKNHLTKPEDFSTASVFGDSLASANGEDWKRHRRLVAPTFDINMFSAIVNESTGIYDHMMESTGWRDRDEIMLNDFNKTVILRFAFVMMSRCGFGMPIQWLQSHEHTDVANFDRSLSVASQTLIQRLIFPKWIYSLPVKPLREIDDSWVTVMKLMDSIASQRQKDFAAQKASGDDEISDLLTKLVSAREGGKYSLESSEVTANMMSLLFAGHETTTSAIYSTLVLLALHPHEQEKAYEEIQHVVPSNVDMTLKNISSLKHVLACFHEAHRLIPATINLTRDIPQEIIIHSLRPVERDFVLHKGSRIMIDVMSVCHNPHDFPNPESYIPSRWYDVPEYDVPMFGFGPRSCVGRKFAQTEALCFLSLLLREWKVDVLLEPGQTRELFLERALDGAGLFGTAFTLGKVPLKFSLRGTSQPVSSTQ